MAQNDIASLAVRVKADISNLQKGLYRAKREIDDFNKKASESQLLLQSRFGVIRAARQGAAAGRQFGLAAGRAVDASLSGAKSLYSYFLKDRSGFTKFERDVHSVGKVLTAGLGGLAVGGTVNAFNSLKSAITSIRNLKPSQLFASMKQGFAALRQAPLRTMFNFGTRQADKIIDKLNNVTLSGFPIGSKFGEKFTSGVERAWAKLRNKPVPIRFNEYTSAAQFQAAGFKANQASRLANITSEFGFKNLMSNAARMNYVIKRMQELSKLKPTSAKGREMEADLRNRLTFDSVYKRIGDSIRGITAGGVLRGIGNFGRSIRGGVSNFFTPRLYTQTNPYSNITTGQMQSPFAHNLQRAFTGAGAALAGIGKGLKYIFSYGSSGFLRMGRIGSTAFSGIFNIASAIPGKLFSLFQTLNPFELFTRSLLAFKTTAVLAIGAITVASVKLSGEFEQFRIGFEALTGSAELGNRTFNEMTQLAAKTPFAIREVLSASKMLLGYGTAAEQLYPTLKMIGDVTSAIGNDYVNLEHVTYLFGTMQQQGHVFTRDVNQLANIGIPIYEELGKVLNVDKQAIQGMVEAGLVGFPEVQKAFINMTKTGSRFGGFMEKQSKSLLGLWRNFMDNLEIAGSKFGDVIVKEFNLKGLLRDMNQLTQNSDVFFAVHADDIKYVVDLVKSMVGYAREFGIHIGAGFRVMIDIAQNLFPNTTKFIEQLAKGGKDLNTSWAQAKNNMVNLFESIAIGFARMMDFIQARVFDFSNDMNRMSDPLGRKNVSDVDNLDRQFGRNMTSLKEELITADGRRNLYRNELEEEKKGLNRPSQIAIRSEKLARAEKEYQRIQNDIDFNRNEMRKQLLGKNEGYYEIYKPNTTNEQDVRKFFEDFKKNVYEADKAAERKANFIAADTIIKGSGLENIRNSQINAMGGMTGGMGVTASHGLLRDIYANPNSYAVKPPGDPENRGVKPAFQLLTKAMQDLIDELKSFKSPLQELREGMFNLDLPYNTGRLNDQQYARGYQNLLIKVGERMGVGETKLAPAIFKGSAEALTIEARAKMGLDQPMKFEDKLQRIMEESVEVEKEQARHLQAISRVLNNRPENQIMSLLNSIIPLGPGG